MQGHVWPTRELSLIKDSWKSLSNDPKTEPLSSCSASSLKAADVQHSQVDELISSCSTKTCHGIATVEWTAYAGYLLSYIKLQQSNAIANMTQRVLQQSSNTTALWQQISELEFKGGKFQRWGKL